LTSDNGPDELDIVPLNVVLVLSNPVVSTAAVTLLFVTVPTPASEPMLASRPRSSILAPAATVKALAAENPPAAPGDRVPSLTLVGPR